MSVYFNEFEAIQLTGSDLQDKTKVNNGYTTHFRGLSGKVVMLIASDVPSVQHLVLQLAMRGADIALVTLAASHDAAQLLKEEVGHEGRRFLHIHTTMSKESPAERIMEMILSQFQHIDVFIDLSADRRKGPVGDGKLTTAAFLSNWNLTEAAIKEIAR